MEDAGLVNVYVCQECGKHTVTKNRDAGTTPFMRPCEDRSCRGNSYSSFYRVNQRLTPSVLWIKPTSEEVLAYLERYPLDRAAIEEHVAGGGLLDVPT